MTFFRISRSGTFGGRGTLDPFGGGRGGLGRYNLGSDIASLEAMEAYAIAVGWQNGTVTDEEYLASLRRLWDLAPPATREWTAAKDKYEDAVHTIARNKIVHDVNLAPTTAERTAALRRLMEHDRSRLGGMVEDNEQRREMMARIRSTEAEIRSSEYGDLVERYNRGRVTTQQLIDFVNRALRDSAGAADNDDWQRTLGDLVDRRNDETIAARMQDYQHDRDDGTNLRAALAAQLATLVPGSPRHLEVSRRMEDLDRRMRETRLAREHDRIYQEWQRGKVSDNAFLASLARAAEEAPAGSREEQAAQHRLLEAQFSMAEDRLQFQVAQGQKGPADLIRFYRTYLTTMNPGSYRARQLILAIDRLKRGEAGGATGGARAGGGRAAGGRAAAGAGHGIAGIEKYLGVPVPWTTELRRTTDVNGKKLPAGALDDLLRLDAADVTDRTWWQNNRRLLDQSYDLGAATWLFLDKNGNSYVLPFSDELYASFLQAGMVGFEAWVDTARNPREAQTAAGMWITAQQRLQRVDRELTMEDYRSAFSRLEQDKQAALASGNIALYIVFTQHQQQLIRSVLGIEDDGIPTDVNESTRPLSSSDRASIASDIDRIAPYQPNAPTTADAEPMNLRGDRIMWAATPEVGIIRFATVRLPDGSEILGDMTIDESRGFFTQQPDGRMDLVSHVEQPDLFEPVTLDDAMGTAVPRYRAGTLTPVVVYTRPEDRTTAAGVNLGPGVPTAAGVTVWVRPSQTLQAPMYVRLHNQGGVPVVGGQPLIAGGATRPVIDERPSGFQLAPTGSGPRVWTQRIKSWGPNGYGWSTWVSVERPGTRSAVWLRLPDGSGVVPRVILDPSPEALAAAGIARFEYGAAGGIVIRYADGTTAAPGADFDWSPFTRFYRPSDGTSAASIGMGAPGVDFEWTIADHQGRLHASRVSERRPERETVDVVGPTGQMLRRRHATDLESAEQAAARLARARGTGPALHRDIDRQAYYDPVTERWRADEAPRPARAPEPPPPSPIPPLPERVPMIGPPGAPPAWVPGRSFEIAPPPRLNGVLGIKPPPLAAGPTRTPVAPARQPAARQPAPRPIERMVYEPEPAAPLPPQPPRPGTPQGKKKAGATRPRAQPAPPRPATAEERLERML